MSFEDMIKNDLDNIFYNTSMGFAKTITYTPDGQWPVSIPAIISYGKNSELRGTDGYGVRATMRVRVSDISQPVKKDQVTINGANWIVLDADLSSDGLEWIISINKVS
jgi:hypothetical protein